MDMNKPVSLPPKTSLMKLDVLQRLIVIYIYFKFHEIRFRGYLVIANYMDLNQFKGYNS